VEVIRMRNFLLSHLGLLLTLMALLGQSYWGQSYWGQSYWGKIVWILGG